MIKSLIVNISEILGIKNNPVSHAEKIVSAIGGFIAICCLYFSSQWVIGPESSAILVASMGASAVLLFAVPHGPLSQPWALIGGHLVSAVMGVSSALLISDQVLAAGVAVGLAIAAMYYLRCIHPPGGATALTAVVGGETVHELGYQFVLTPVLMNVTIIIVIAVVFNYFFAWRRYPLFLYKTKQEEILPSHETEDSYGEISHADFVYALSQIDSFIDVTEYDLLRIYELATKQADNRKVYTEEIALWSYYSNGKYGDEWSVRQLVDESPSDDSEKDMLIYKVVAGDKRRTSGVTTRIDFARWAKHEVERDEDNWKKVVKN